MEHIDGRSGDFITIMPKTRSEDSLFRKWLKSNQIQWEEILRKTNGNNSLENESIYYGFESPQTSSEGYRIIWYLSSDKQKSDAKIRQNRIQKTIKALAELKDKTGKRKLKTSEQITNAINAILDKNKSAFFLIGS